MTFAAEEPGRRRRAAKRRVVMSEVNIVSHPHSVDSYLEAFESLYEQRLHVQYHAHRQIEIGTCKRLEDERIPNALTGLFFVFSKINFDDPWLNIQRNTEATDTDLEQLRIPAHLAPEFRQFRYVFDVRKHTLYFEKYTLGRHHLSPKAFVHALNRLVKHPSMQGRFEEINAFLVTDEEAIEQILSLNKLRKLFVKIFRPNPDDDDFEQDILESMDEQEVGVLETTYIKAPGAKAIIPNAITRQLAHLAARVGFVEGKGKDENNAPVTVNTEDHPKEHNIVFKETDDTLDKIIDHISNIDKINKDAAGDTGGDG